MVADEDSVAADLKRLQRNRGLQSANLADRVGPSLAQLTGFDPSRGSAARDSLIRQLARAAEDLQPDMRVVFSRACAMRPDDAPTLGERLARAGVYVNRNAEVLRRWVDRANKQVAQRLIETSAGDRGWFVDEFTTRVDFRETQPVYRAKRTLVVTAPRLSSIVEMISFPGDRADMRPEFNATGPVSLRSIQRIAPQTWQSELLLDREYQCGELITYSSAARLSHRRFAPPMSVMAPRRECRRFATEVRLGELAQQVWMLDRVASPTVYVDAPMGPILDHHRDPVVRAEFRNLIPGMVYGLRWIWATSAL